VAPWHTLHVGAGGVAALSASYEQYCNAFVAVVVTAVLQYAKQSSAEAIAVVAAAQPAVGASF